MTDTRQKAIKLYQSFGLQKASFIAFDNMQNAKNPEETDFWLRIINHIAVIDIHTLEENSLLKKES